MTALTADEFERGYAERSGITVERLRELGRVVRPCACQEDGCPGWQSMSKERAIEYDVLEEWRQARHERLPG